MDGTLVNSSLTIANAINYVRENLGFEPMEQEYILKRVNDHTINPAQIFYHAKAFDADHERWFSEYYTKNHENELVLYDGIKELLESLKDKGHKMNGSCFYLKQFFPVRILTEPADYCIFTMDITSIQCFHNMVS